MSEKSLYERLGGYDAIAAVCDDLLERLFSDPQLQGYWRGHSENSLRRERQLLVDYIAEAAGGPVYYLGRDMKTSHTGLRISESDWDVMAGHLAATLEKLQVPAQEQQEVFAFGTSIKGDIVEHA
jgi:hemoglobin